MGFPGPALLLDMLLDFGPHRAVGGRSWYDALTLADRRARLLRKRLFISEV